VIYARLIASGAPGRESLRSLLNALMATIVLPYRGHPAAARELARLTPEACGGAEAKGGKSLAPKRHGTQVDFRLTVRTHMVLTAVAECPGGSNRQLSDAAGIRDQGQISKLLTRLEGYGLLTNTGGETHGSPNAWRLTVQGEEVIRASRPQGGERAVERSGPRSRAYGRKAGRGRGMA
jgi:DNA-binding MarR family transcriptional regulator